MSAASFISASFMRLDMSAVISHMSAHISQIRAQMRIMSASPFMLEQRIIMSAHMRHMSAQDINIMPICIDWSPRISMLRGIIRSHMLWHWLHISMHCCISVLISRVITNLLRSKPPTGTWPGRCCNTGEVLPAPPPAHLDALHTARLSRSQDVRQGVFMS
jgi:hypothetical protein